MNMAMIGAKAGAAAITLAALSLAACNTTTPEAVATPVVVAPEPPAPGVVGVSVGQALDEKDRQIAIAAQQAAVSDGVRKTWKGAHGAYGFIAPGAESGGCRDYTHKIFVNGRPQEAKGSACKKGDGWRVTS
jgi:surface antigen